MLRLWADATEVIVGHTWQDVVFGLIITIPPTLAGLVAWKNSSKAKKNTQPNGGSSAYDLQNAALIGRLDGWGGVLERQIKAADDNAREAARAAALAAVEAKKAAIKLDEHLVDSKSRATIYETEALKGLARLTALENGKDAQGNTVSPD
jgi:hypothetical protein